MLISCCLSLLLPQKVPCKQLPIGSPPQANNGGGGAIPRRRINSNPFATNSRPTTLMSQSWTSNSVLQSQLHPQQQQQQQQHKQQKNSPSALLAPLVPTPTKGAGVGDPFGNPGGGKCAVAPEPKICPATGNMFQRRKDLTIFHTLPYPKRNPYHIKIDDEGPHGKESRNSFRY